MEELEKLEEELVVQSYRSYIDVDFRFGYYPDVQLPWRLGLNIVLMLPSMQLHRSIGGEEELLCRNYCRWSRSCHLVSSVCPSVLSCLLS